MANTDQPLAARQDRPDRCPQVVASPPAHLGIVHALNACFAKPPAVPDEFRRLLDRLC